MKLRVAFDEELAKIIEIIETESVSKANLQPVADDLANQVRVRTRSGKGVSDPGGEEETLKPVSERYANLRKGIVEFKAKKGRSTKTVRFKVKVPNLHPEAAGGDKSNLTATGQMLDAIKGTVPSKGLIRLVLSGARSGLDIFGKRRSSEPTNEAIKDFQESQGRSFFTLSANEISRLEQSIRQVILNKLSRK